VALGETHRQLRQFLLQSPRMKAGRFCIVLVTAPSLAVARRLAKGALNARFVACVNIVPKVESHYWWRGKIEKGNEVLLICKTLKPRLADLERFIVAHHPYDTSEFVVLPIAGGYERYLAWIETSLTST
jgi:periplasmic divalent cation tolerance protein